MIADELLELAASLASTDASQASIRRSISTSYYAVFHLLIQEASNLWPGSDVEKVALERAFSHGTMKTVSKQFGSRSWVNAFDASVSVPEEIQRVAKAFTLMQEYRHEADYFNYRHWSTKDAEAVLQTAKQAFKDWRAIRETSIARSYLLAMLLGKSR